MQRTVPQHLLTTYGCAGTPRFVTAVHSGRQVSTQGKEQGNQESGGEYRSLKTEMLLLLLFHDF